jgi:N-acetylglucosaminyl-diphospho-decaprenol L-rhamnosyltransferase
MRAGVTPRVTIVVLSYNRPELLRTALGSIAAQSETGCEVIVVDNASPRSDLVRDVVAEFPGVRLIANAANLGFTGGMNCGIAAAAGKYLYLTEDDIELDPDCVAALVAHLEQHEEVSLAGPVMWNREAATVRCAGGSFRLAAVYEMRVLGVGQREIVEETPYPTMYLPGAAIAARTAVLRRLGGFRSDFFMYGEDVELCARALECGGAVVVVPRARVYHHEPTSLAESFRVRFHKQKNFIALYLLHAPIHVLPGFLARYVVIEGIRRFARDWGSLPAWSSGVIVALVRAPQLLAQRARRTCAT